MLPRRHIRIKVFQSLYALAQQNEDTTFNLEKEFNNNLEGYRKLYLFIVNLLAVMRNVAEDEINIKRANLIPSETDLAPNKKFIQNSFLLKIRNQNTKYTEQEKEKIKIIIKRLFQTIQKSETYINYMKHEKQSKEDDKKIILHILKNYLIIYEKLHEIIEDFSIYWNDDILVVYNFLLEKIKNNKPLNTAKIFRNKEDQVFAKKLLKETMQREKEISTFIYDLAKNWDKERIALSDLIIMRMAMTEIKYLKDIPHKVTIDEYIEISKQYSTPKSKEFINGILDVFIKEFFMKK